MSEFKLTVKLLYETIKSLLIFLRCFVFFSKENNVFQTEWSHYTSVVQDERKV